MKTCPRCDGEGIAYIQSKSSSGSMKTCPLCRGKKVLKSNIAYYFWSVLITFCYILAAAMVLFWIIMIPVTLLLIIYSIFFE